MKWFKQLKQLFSTKHDDSSTDPANLEDDRLDISEREHLVQSIRLEPSIEANLKALKKMIGPSWDIPIRPLLLGTHRVPAAVVIIEGFSDKNQVAELTQALTVELLNSPLRDTPAESLPEAIVGRLLQSSKIDYADTLDGLWRLLTGGNTVILVDGYNRAIGCSSEGAVYRAIEEPSSETVMRGPRDGFIESIAENMSLVRRRLRTPNLWSERFIVGSLTKTQVAMLYIKGLAHEELIEELRQRISRIRIDGILGAGQIEEFIEDQPASLFPLVFQTERPDRAASMLLEGRIAIMIDGTPFVLCVPTEFSMLLHAPDDYYEKVPSGTILGSLRYLAFWSSILIPGAYTATLTFHQELIPTELLIKIIASREGVPFPVAVEVFLMEFVFELLREAGLRLPKAIGSAVTIVGALILGDAAINAGLVSPPVVIVVALTALSSFSTPTYSFSLAARLSRFVFVILGAVLGLFGVQFGFLLLLMFLTSLRSFGYPYFSPFGPLILSNMKDVLYRTWWWDMIRRPFPVGSREPIRQPPGRKPRPGLEKEEVEKREARRSE
ncbi:MAG: spore germination protein [Bacillota bacterium]|jgi:spore germination protein KA|nr:spore germination protein [Bacillota bacterium]